ncbi:MAG: deoxyribose-phosphate aldolase, partial [Sulfitobacter sp. SK025]
MVTSDNTKEPLDLPRNPGKALNLDWVEAAHANTPAINRRIATLSGRRTVKKAHQ